MNLLYINLTILRKNYFQKIIEKSGIDLLLQFSLMSESIENSKILIVASAFNLL